MSPSPAQTPTAATATTTAAAAATRGADGKDLNRQLIILDLTVLFTMCRLLGMADINVTVCVYCEY